MISLETKLVVFDSQPLIDSTASPEWKLSSMLVPFLFFFVAGVSYSAFLNYFLMVCIQLSFPKCLGNLCCSHWNVCIYNPFTALTAAFYDIYRIAADQF